MSSYYPLQARCCAIQSYVESHIQTTTHTISSTHLIWVPCRTTVRSPGLQWREKERCFRTTAQSIDACLKGHLVYSQTAVFISAWICFDFHSLYTGSDNLQLRWIRSTQSLTQAVRQRAALNPSCCLYKICKYPMTEKVNLSRFLSVPRLTWYLTFTGS